MSDSTPVTSPTVDPAALGTSAMAALLALVVSPGRWGWLAAGAGIALGLLLAGYYRPKNWPPTGSIDRLTRACAFGGIAGLLAAMAFSWPMQAIVDLSGATNFCNFQAEPDNCAGGVAEPWVMLTWLLMGILLSVIHYIIVKPASSN